MKKKKENHKADKVCIELVEKIKGVAWHNEPD